MYAAGGVVRTVSGNVAMVAGSTWGGGTAVNYSASLQTPAKLREEWSREHGLDFAVTAEFQECLDMYVVSFPPRRRRPADFSAVKSLRPHGRFD
jgi:hypothetical protein